MIVGWHIDDAGVGKAGIIGMRHVHAVVSRCSGRYQKRCAGLGKIGRGGEGQADAEREQLFFHERIPHLHKIGTLYVVHYTPFRQKWVCLGRLCGQSGFRRPGRMFFYYKLQ